MTVRPILVLPTDPEPERRARIQFRLNQLGEGPAALFHDLCLLLDEDLGLEARPMLVSHLLRELESSVREVLRPRRVDIAGESMDGRASRRRPARARSTSARSTLSSTPSVWTGAVPPARPGTRWPRTSTVSPTAPT